MPREPNRLFVRPLGEREAEALRLIEAHPGVTARELADRLGVTTNGCGRSCGGLRVAGCGEGANRSPTEAGYWAGDVAA